MGGHRPGPAPGKKNRGIIHHGGQGIRIHGSRHDQNPYIRIKDLGRLKTQGQPQIPVDMPFMEFVKDEQAHALKTGVGLDPPGQYPFGDDFDAGIRADAPVHADLISHGLPGFLS